ncbi:hypothetical protein DV515_00000215 [Chloebia gouldiae]|uniref:Uncharacterized protein n=1 Tax=Chloebia gouldiae TaxID=44316 RepID=A0A3L8T218_CHLGU|nr:hypothetical protein DV515_00000215 [Chloebia gouldiae]
MQVIQLTCPTSLFMSRYWSSGHSLCAWVLDFNDPVAAVKPNHVLRELPTIGVRVKKQKKRMDVNNEMFEEESYEGHLLQQL